jgi:transposase-like protein
MANKNRDGKREAFWRGALQRQARGGHSVRAFCRREQLSEPSFYAWRRTIGERDAAGQQSPRPAFLPAAILPPAILPPAILPPAILPPAIRDASTSDGSITIELRGGRVLRLPESIETERLAALVHAIESEAAR